MCALTSCTRLCCLFLFDSMEKFFKEIQRARELRIFNGKCAFLLHFFFTPDASRFDRAVNEARKIRTEVRSRASFSALNISRAELSEAEVESPTAYCLWILIRGDKLLLQLDASIARSALEKMMHKRLRCAWILLI